MPQLANARHETFANLVASGMAHGPAYAESGFNSTGNAAEVSAVRLLRNVKVVARVSELMAESVERIQITADDIANEAWSIAKNERQPGVARVSALTLLAKRHPEFSDKIDARVLHGVVKVERGTRSLT